MPDNTNENRDIPSIENAPDDIKLAVDLIYLIESNEIDTDTAISALQIVLSDLQRKKAGH
ncbi:pleiotropic regulatory protein RsmS [Parasalinivibrio latis]|uniref:pleiotropic regulatory protein RsmS n=1 Tax=Parasalinivibrio latis TaxID=2952610 RepID=UPI0030DEC41F